MWMKEEFGKLKNDNTNLTNEVNELKKANGELVKKSVNLKIK